MKITPETAIDHLDEAASKYHGTRDDHTVLNAAIALLRETVADWRRLKDARESLEVVSGD
jgi:hypothetical protein